MDICKIILNRGDGMMYLSKVIEAAERGLRENPGLTTAELAEMVCASIERPDNFWAILHTHVNFSEEEKLKVY